jgi:hypothetical protein
MVKHLRPLALANLAVAVIFLLPVAFWVLAETLSTGSLKVTLPAVDTTAESLAEIQSITDIENLRHRAKILTEMRQFDKRWREDDAQMTKRLFEWFAIFMAFSGAAFLLNAGTIWWLSRKSAPPVIASAL